MKPKRVYFPKTTVQQRRLLFETWEETGSVTKACRVAHMGRGSFYYWKPRFDQAGYAGLEQFESCAPHTTPHRKSATLEQRVLQLHEEHQEWGKARMAHELAKENQWVPQISPNTVRRILKEAGKWPQTPQPGRKKGASRSDG